MLEKFRVKNFRCFEDTGDIEVRPLTLFLGPNSSGKSSILHLLLALRQTAESTDADTAFAPNDGWVHLGSYPDFVFRHEWKREIEVTLEFTAPKSPVPRSLTLLPWPIAFWVKWKYNRKTTQIHLCESSTRLGESWEETIHRQDKGGYEVVVKSLKGGPAPGGERITAERLSSLRAAVVEVSDGKTRYTLTLLIGMAALRAELRRMMYLGPLREHPQRAYVVSGQAPSDVGVRGERAADVLWFVSRTKRKRHNILTRINEWLKAFGIANELRLQRLGKSDHYQILFVDPHSKLPVNISDVGFGASQILPLIVQASYAPPGSLLLIEQPEIHLHPRAQAVLGDLLLKTAIQGQTRVIVETHSEHLLARIQRRIAESDGGALAKNVAVYYFEPTSDGTKIQRIELDEYGHLTEPIPSGFFEEGLTEAVEHMKAVSERKKKRDSGL